MGEKTSKVEQRTINESITPKGIIIAIGGKEDKGESGNHVHEGNGNFIELDILTRFTEELKRENPLVLIIPTASSEPDEVAKDYVKVFSKLKIKNIKIADIRTREDAAKPEIIELIKEADGILFTGGDQLKLTAILGGTELLFVLKQRFIKDAIVIAGTSAGAAAMSTGMIYEGQKDNGMFKGDVRSTTGLEFLKNVAIDTHFISRGRMIRMAHRLASNPGCIGIGLEEDTGIVVKAGREAEVIGSGLIVVMDARGCTATNIHEVDNGDPVTLRNLKVDLLGKGDTFLIPDFNQLHSY